MPTSDICCWKWTWQGRNGHLECRFRVIHWGPQLGRSRSHPRAAGSSGTTNRLSLPEYRPSAYGPWRLTALVAKRRCHPGTTSSLLRSASSEYAPRARPDLVRSRPVWSANVRDLAQVGQTGERLQTCRRTDVGSTSSGDAERGYQSPMDSLPARVPTPRQIRRSMLLLAFLTDPSAMST